MVVEPLSSQIRKQLDTVISPKSKLTKPFKKPKATWVEPKFFGDIEYRDITSEGLLRQSSFKRLSRMPNRLRGAPPVRLRAYELKSIIWHIYPPELALCRRYVRHRRHCSLRI